MLGGHIAPVEQDALLATAGAALDASRFLAGGRQTRCARPTSRPGATPGESSESSATQRYIAPLSR